MRNSSIELLRIVSILMIISMHVLGVNFMDSTTIIDKEFVIFINSFCNAGVTIFVLISGFYGIRFKKDKLFYMANQTWFYSILLFGIGYLVFSSFSTDSLLRSLFPIVTNKYWFISSYIVLYVVSPYFNSVLDGLSKKNYVTLLFFLITVFIIAPTFLKFELTHDGGKGPVNMILAYMTGYYFKRFDFPTLIQKYSVIILILSFFAVFGLSSLLSYHSEQISKAFFRDNGLFIFMIAVSMLYLFSTKNFYNMTINNIAKLTLGVYLVQETLKLWIPKFTSNIFIYWISSVLALYLLSLLIEFVRMRLCDSIFKRLSCWEVSITSKVLQRITRI